MTREIELEPMSEDEMICEYCGSPASWDVIDDAYQVNYVCHKHHTRMLEKNEVLAERRIGPDTWEEVESYKILLNKWGLENHEGKKTT